MNRNIKIFFAVNSAIFFTFVLFQNCSGGLKSGSLSQSSTNSSSATNTDTPTSSDPVLSNPKKCIDPDSNASVEAGLYYNQSYYNLSTGTQDQCAAAFRMANISRCDGVTGKFVPEVSAMRFSQCTVVAVEPPPPPPVTSTGVLWAAGTCGHVQKSLDNGVTFQDVKSITTVTGQVYNLQNYASCSDYDHGAPSLYGLAYGNNRLVMATWNIGSSLGTATTNQIRLYSDDKGVTWNSFPHTSVIDQAFWKISFSESGKFFIGSTHYGSSRVVKSVDGVTWTPVVQGCTTDPVCKFRCSATAGNYFIVGGDGSNFFSGLAASTALTPATLGVSRSFTADSRRSTSSTFFGVLGGDGSNQLAVVDGRTGFSGLVSLSNPVISGLFNGNNKIFYTSGTAVYRSDLNCTSQNNCTGPSVRVATLNMSVGRMWFLNGYLYGLSRASGGISQIYRSTTVFNTEANTPSTVTLALIQTNATNLPASVEVKEMVYIP